MLDTVQIEFGQARMSDVTAGYGVMKSNTFATPFWPRN
jgi:hypothetical protein